MPKSGARLWWFTLVICTAVAVALGYGLRLRWPAGIADPIAQAVALTLSFALCWPWLKDRGARVSFPALMAFVSSVAFLIVVLRIRFLQ